MSDFAKFGIFQYTKVSSLSNPFFLLIRPSEEIAYADAAKSLNFYLLLSRNC